MTPYFTVQPKGLGTVATECLSSAIQRIAVAHGATRYQFITSLSHWWMIEKGRHLPRCEELRWDGYSPNVAIALEALRDAIGIDFKGCTLIPLMQTCAANCVGALSRIRYWCPACFGDDLASGEPTYDRLVWRVQGYRRCSIHKLRLRTACPHCAQHQTRDTSREHLHLCLACRQSLATSITRSEYEPRPEFGEEQVELLVRSIGSLGICQEQPLRKFFQHFEGAEEYVARHLGDILHNRTLPARPQLTSLIAIATHFGVDITQLITAPEEAARQASLEIRRPPRMRSTRPSSHMRQKRTAWFKYQLELAISNGPPFPSTDEFCRRHDYSVTAARNTFPDLTSKLSRKHLEWKKSMANRQKAEAIAAIAALSEVRSQLTVKELVRSVCARSGAPVHVVRALVDDS